MNKFYTFLLIFPLIILCGACNTGTVDENSLNTTLSSTTGGNNIFPQNSDMVYYEAYGKLTQSSSYDEVVIFSHSSQSDYDTEVFLSAKTNENIYSYNLGKWDSSVFERGQLYVTDLNNDEIDEIILYMEVTKNGGSLAQVFSVEDKGITLICDLNELDLQIDTIYSDDYCMILENKTVNFSCNIDISNQFAPERFDSKGKALVSSKIWLLPIDSCELVINGDLREIHCTRICRLTDYLGVIDIVFDYNGVSDSFEVKELSYKGVNQ